MFKIRLLPAFLVIFLLTSLFFAFTFTRAVRVPTVSFGDLVVRQFDEEYKITDHSLSSLFEWDIKSIVFTKSTIYFGFYYPFRQYDSKMRLFHISDLVSQAKKKSIDFSQYPNIIIYNKWTREFTLLNADKKVISWPTSGYDLDIVDRLLRSNTIDLPDTGFLAKKFRVGSTIPTENSENKEYFPIIQQYWKKYPFLIQ